MASAPRPTASKRFSSTDLENSFFRAWALRGSEGSNSASVSQPLSLASTPSSVSPTTQTPDRKVKNIPCRRNLSEANIPRPPLIRASPAVTIIPGQDVPAVVQEQQIPSTTRTSAASTSSNGEGASRSSIGSRTKRLFTTPSIRSAPNAIKDGRPPGKNVDGFKWKHQISGHWFEISVGKKRSCEAVESRAEGPSQSVSIPEVDISEDAKAVSNTSTPHLLNATDTYLHLSSDSALHQGSPVLLHSHGYTKEGLYDRTKKALGLKQVPAKTSLPLMEQRRVPGDTKEVLDRTSSALLHLFESRLAIRRRNKTSPVATASNSNSNVSTESPNSAQKRWSRPASSIRTGTESTSSSLRSLMMGKPPAPTPEPEAMYRDANHNLYFSVKLTDPGAPSYLPSEARRINTPPLGTPLMTKGKLRGFFFDYNAPTEDKTLSFPQLQASALDSKRLEGPAPFLQVLEPDYMGPEALSDSGRRTPQLPSRALRTDWYRVNIDAIDAEVAEANELFVLSVAEHLPNSPMCPKHPKNRSKGKGVCVHHGRNPSGADTTADKIGPISNQ